MNGSAVTTFVAVGPANPDAYNPEDSAENLKEYGGVAIAFILSALVIWLVIRKDLKT